MPNIAFSDARVKVELNGIWKGQIETTWSDSQPEVTQGPIKATVRIKQSLLSTSVRLKTAESHSQSTRCHLEADRDAGLFRILYSYHNWPKATVRDRSARHHGFARLEYHPTQITINSRSNTTPTGARSATSNFVVMREEQHRRRRRARREARF